MKESLLSAAFSASFTAHPDDDILFQYFARNLTTQHEGAVRRHLTFCDECCDRARICRVELAATTGFDALSGQRFHNDAEWEVEGITPLVAVPPSELWRQAAAPAADVAESREFKPSEESRLATGDLVVKLSLIEDKLQATIVRPNGMAVPHVEVRLEMRGFHESDRDFTLYAWNLTNEYGQADLGPVRHLDFFTGGHGHRFVLGVVMPETDPPV